MEDININYSPINKSKTMPFFLSLTPHYLYIYSFDTIQQKTWVCRIKCYNPDCTRFMFFCMLVNSTKMYEISNTIIGKTTSHSNILVD